MANTYVLIKKVEVTSGQANILLDSIPSTYTDLLIYHSLRTNRGAYHESITMHFNGVTTNRTNRRIYGVGSAPQLSTDTIMYGGQANGSTNTPSTSFGTSIVYISAYTASRNKISLELGGSETNDTNTLRDLNANIWSSTDAVNSITLVPENGNTIQAGSSVYLYGIKNS